jgi:ABC-type Mn2+/Zn2+ transport system ATPase subunit
MSELEPLVALRGADLGYENALVLRGVDLDLHRGELVAIAGPNGSGKTTLFRTILGFLPLLSGTLIRRCQLRDFGYVPQSASLDSMFPVTAAEVVEMGGYGRLKPYRGTPAAEKSRLRETLQQVGLSDVAGRLFFSLSGGQRQRVLIARALMVGPKILILDEPLAGCDPESQKAISEVLVELSARQGKTVLFSSHDLRMVRSVTRHILRIDDGRIEREERARTDHPW